MRFIETPIFTRDVVRLISEDEYHSIQEDLTHEQARVLSKLVREEFK
jgi:hypothetical protein